jgi:hypothetical protein
MLVTLCGLLAVPSGAGAATIFGSNLLGDINWEACAGETETWSCTFANPDLPEASQAAGGAAAPSAGVLTSWRVKAGDSVGTIERKLRLRVLRGYTGVGTGSLESLPLTAGIYSYATRLPVKAGDRLGLDFPDTAGGEPVPVLSAAPGVTLDYWNPPLGEGVETLPNSPEPSQELLVQATLESDADGDGFGDETQDKCVGTAGPADGCLATVIVDPPPVDPPPVGPLPTEPAPDTRVGKVTIQAAKGKVTFRFTSTVQGAKFQCKLDKKPWKSCKSPRIYKNLGDGRHRFKVKAIGPTALPDPTPAKRSFKVEL